MKEAKSNCNLERRVYPSFPYIETLIQGKPEIKGHPPMDLVHRAKIFAPFDALSGYSELIRDVNRRHEEPPREKTEPNICAFWDDP